MSSQIQIPQVQESGYGLPSQAQDLQQQQPVIHASMHYTHHPPPGAAVPISSYYQMYAPPPQNQQQQLHYQIEQQYPPVYFLPITQPQTYNLPLQANVSADSSHSTTVTAPGRSLTPPTPAMVTPSGVTPIYPTKPEMAGASVYRTVATASPPLVQVPPSSQFHQQNQYMGFSQLHHPPPPVAAAATAPNYAYEYAHPAQDQTYCTHHSVAPLPQYQTLTSTTAVALSEASTQLPPPWLN